MHRALALALLALVPMLPVLLPGAIAYMDNAAHLVTVRDIADIVREEGWFSGWGTRANAGMAVNQVNAPLVWLGVAMLGGIFGTIPVYLFGMLASNVVFALGAHRFFRRFLHPDAAWFGAGLAALSAPDLYGFGGAAGGMWPHRLANGLLLAGLGATGPASPGKIGLWLAVVLLCHTYSGMDAAAIVGIAIVLDLAARRWRDFARHTAGAVIGALIAAPFWVPLLDGALRPSLPGEIRFLNVLDHLALVLLPLSMTRLNQPWEYEYLGGPLGFAWSVLLVAGLAGAWSARATLREALRPLLRPPLVAFPLFLVLLVGIVVVVVPVTLTEAFGPNPWRHLTIVRAVVCALAGAGLVALGYGFRSAVTALLFLIGAAGAWGGVLEMRPPVDAEGTALRADLRAAWHDLEAAGVQGRVYHQNTSLKNGAPKALFPSHIGALVAYETDLPVVGAWYSISPVASEPTMRSSRNGLFGALPDRWYSNPAAFWERARAFDLGAAVTVEPAFAAFLKDQPGVRLVGEHGPFAAFLLPSGGLGAFDCPETFVCADVRAGRGWAEARIDASGASAATVVALRETWHPWWTATLDGVPVPVSREKSTARINVELPPFEGEKTLALRWVDPTRWTVWVALVGLVAAAVAWRGRRAVADEARQAA